MKIPKLIYIIIIIKAAILFACFHCGSFSITIVTNFLFVVLFQFCCHVRIDLEPVTLVEAQYLEPVTPVEFHNVEPVMPMKDRIA